MTCECGHDHVLPSGLVCYEPSCDCIRYRLADRPACPTKHRTDEVPFEGLSVPIPIPWNHVYPSMKYCPDCGEKLKEDG